MTPDSPHGVAREAGEFVLIDQGPDGNIVAAETPGDPESSVVSAQHQGSPNL